MIAFVVSLTLIADQASKFFISRMLSLHESVPVIPGVFHLTLVHNRGAAFGILKNQLPLFIFTSVFAMILIYSSLKRSSGSKKTGLNDLALSLILAGAAGNLIDRLVFGYVIDFLDFCVWPVFNIADSAITIGAVLLGYSLFADSRSKKEQGPSCKSSA